MNGQKDIKAVRLGIIIVVLISATGVFGGMLPAAGMLIYLISVMFFICAERYGFVFSLPFLIAAYVFVAFSTSFYSAIADVIAPGLTAIFMGELLRLKRSQGETLTKGIIIGAMCNVVSIVLVTVFEKISLVDNLRKEAEKVINYAVDKNELTIYSAEMLRQSYETMLQAVPGILISFSIIGTIFIYFSGCSFLLKRGENIPEYLRFRNLSFSGVIIWGSLLMLALGYIIGLTGLVDSDILIMNISIVVGVLFSIQGLSVLSYIREIIKFPGIIFIIIICFVVISIVGLSVLFVTGILDIIFNIRKRIDIKRG